MKSPFRKYKMRSSFNSFFFFNTIFKFIALYPKMIMKISNNVKGDQYGRRASRVCPTSQTRLILEEYIKSKLVRISGRLLIFQQDYAYQWTWQQLHYVYVESHTICVRSPYYLPFHATFNFISRLTRHSHNTHQRTFIIYDEDVKPVKPSLARQIFFKSKTFNVSFSFAFVGLSR